MLNKFNSTFQQEKKQKKTHNSSIDFVTSKFFNDLSNITGMWKKTLKLKFSNWSHIFTFSQTCKITLSKSDFCFPHGDLYEHLQWWAEGQPL